MIHGAPLSELGPVVACDTETTGLAPKRGDRPFMILFMDEDERFTAYYWPVDPLTREVQFDEAELDELRAFFGDTGRRFVFHHGKFDIQMLSSVGINLPASRWDDTLIAARVLRSSVPAAGLKPLAHKFCGVPVEDEKDLQRAVVRARREGKQKGWALAGSPKADYWMAPNECLRYGKGDVFRTILLWYLFRDLLEGKEAALRPVYDREMRLQPVVIDMEQRGIYCDAESVVQGIEESTESVLDIRSRLEDLTRIPGFNPNSPNDISSFFFHSGRFPVLSRTTSGAPKTDKATMEQIDHPVARLILEFKKEDKLRQFFQSWLSLVEKGVIYGSFEPQAAHTGRFGARNPNLQQVPKRDPVAKKRCRRPFRPRPGYAWMAFDFSQMELMMLAGLAREEGMMDAFRNGRDVHRETAVSIWGEDAVAADPALRTQAKACTFGISYGAGPGKLAASIGGSLADGQILLDDYFAAFPGVKDFMDACVSEAESTGAVVNPYGRRVEVHRESAYAALNYKIQSSGADVVKTAMLRVHNWLRANHPHAGLVLQIHDEIVVEAPRAEATLDMMREIRRLMAEGTEDVFGIPLKVDVEYVMDGRSWGSAAPVNV